MATTYSCTSCALHKLGNNIHIAVNENSTLAWCTTSITIHSSPVTCLMDISDESPTNISNSTYKNLISLLLLIAHSPLLRFPISVLIFPVYFQETTTKPGTWEASSMPPFPSWAHQVSVYLDSSVIHPLFSISSYYLPSLRSHHLSLFLSTI